MTKHILLILTLLALAASEAHAAKAWSVPTAITQPDGTTLQVILHGDEHGSWYATTDGILLVQRPQGYYVATVDMAGKLHPTDQLAHEVAVRSHKEVTLAKSQNRKLFYQTTALEMQHTRAAIAGGRRYFPHSGSPKALVVLVQFADKHFVADSLGLDTRQIFDDYLNYTSESTYAIPNRGIRNRNICSAGQFFSIVSDGSFKPQFDIVGPVTVSKGWRYYGRDSLRTDYHVNEMMSEACQLIDGQVDFSNYDADGDGYADLVYFIYAGYAQSISGNSSDCIWPKSGTAALGTYDHVAVYRYGVNNELNHYPLARNGRGELRGNEINGIGLFCHEFSHTMGLPDLYVFNANGTTNSDIASLEYWDLMDGGEYTYNGLAPTPYSPWEKEVMGWAAHETLRDGGTYSLQNGEAMKLMADNGEYLMLTNCQRKGLYDGIAQLGHGMLVYRISYATGTDDQVIMTDRPNTLPNLKIVLLPADGNILTAKGANYEASTYRASFSGDPYPGTANATTIGPVEMLGTTIPGTPITGIDETDGIITFNYADSHTGIRTTKHRKGDEISQYYTPDGIAAGKDRDKLPPGLYIKNGQRIIVP